jgi:hypothetical protein
LQQFLEALLQLLIKESKVTVLSQQNAESTVIAENTDVSWNCGADNKARERITAPAFCSLPSVSKKKIFEIRQQLSEGKYDIDKRLDIALDRLLENIIAKDRIDYLWPNPDPLR